jgi:hypothetical protein
LAELTEDERQDYEQKQHKQQQQQQQQLEEQQRGETKLPVEIDSPTTTTGERHNLPESSSTSDQIMEDAAPSTSIIASSAEAIIDVVSTPAAEAAFQGTPRESSESNQQGDDDNVFVPTTSSEEPPLKRVRLNDPVVPQATTSASAVAPASNDTAIQTTEPLINDPVPPQATSASATPATNDTAIQTTEPLIIADEDVNVSTTAIKRTRFDEEEPSSPTLVGEEPTSKRVRIEELPPTEREPFPTADAPVATLAASTTTTSIPSQPLDDFPKDEGVTILEHPALEPQQEESPTTTAETPNDDDSSKQPQPEAA